MATRGLAAEAKRSPKGESVLPVGRLPSQVITNLVARRMMRRQGPEATGRLRQARLWLGPTSPYGRAGSPMPSLRVSPASTGEE